MEVLDAGMHDASREAGITITVAPGGPYAGFYTGFSADAGGNVTFASNDHTEFVFSKFLTTAGWIPKNTELIVWGPMICL